MNQIIQQLKNLLREIVYLQDEGKINLEDFSRAGFEQSFIDRIMVAAHTERLKMIHEGIDVYNPPEGKKGFTIGLSPWPYKMPCDHEWYPAEETTASSTPRKMYCPKCGRTQQDSP